MYNLVDVVCKLMGEHYTYLNEKKDFIKEQICLEEERFLSTIENGIEILIKSLKIPKKFLAERLHSSFMILMVFHLI